jgi:hypothetical protein
MGLGSVFVMVILLVWGTSLFAKPDPSNIDLEKLAFHDGDLPESIQPGDVSTEIGAAFVEILGESVLTISIKKTLLMELLSDDESIGGVLVFLLSDDQEAALLYEELVRYWNEEVFGHGMGELLDSDITYKAPYLGDRALLYYGTEKYRLHFGDDTFEDEYAGIIFSRCNAVVMVGFEEEKHLQTVQSYAQKLDERFLNTVCPGWQRLLP